MNLSCKEFSVYRLFNTYSGIEIPPYQRGYAWKKEQISQFVDDLETCLFGRQQNKDSDHHHFFGGIVSIEDDKKIEIIDGQQRLTTFVLLVSQIRSSLNEYTDRNSEVFTKKQIEELNCFSVAFANDYIYYNDSYNVRKSSELRLKPTHKDIAFFENLLSEGIRPNKKNRPESHANLNNASRQLRQFVDDSIINSEVEPKNVLKNLNHIREILEKDCIFIFISTAERNKAYQYFQVLNDRGVQLTTGDLLKADTLKQLSGKEYSKNSTNVERMWDTILIKNSAEIENELQVYAASVTGERPSKLELYKVFSEKIIGLGDIGNGKQKLGLELEKKVKQIVDGITVIRRLKKATWRPDNYEPTLWEQERLRSLIKRLKQRLALPLLLSLATQSDPKEFYKIVCVLERFIFRYITVGQRRASRMEAIFLEASDKIRGNSPVAFCSEKFREELLKLCESEVKNTLFREMLNDFKYEKGSVDGLRVLFVGLESYMPWYEKGGIGMPECKDMVNAIDSDRLTVEHVYPQTAKDGKSNDELEKVKHEIGNLTVLGPSENSVNSNKNFSEKRIMFEKSNFMLNRAIAKNKNWSNVEVKERQRELIEMAVKIFVP